MTKNEFQRWMLGATAAVALGCSNQNKTTTNPLVGVAGASDTSSAGTSGTVAPTTGGASGTKSMTPVGTGASGSTSPPTSGAGHPATAGASAAGMLAPGTSGTTGASGSNANAASGVGGGASGTGAAGSSNGSPFPQLPRVMTTDGPGPFSSVVKVMSTPPGGWMIYPTEIGMNGMKHPLFIFGPGGGTTPETYDMDGMHWDRYGSYGFVIYVLPMSTGNGADMKAGLDWLIAQNDDMTSPLYQHLDTSKVCAAGHSEGGITVFDFMPDPRVTTTVIISGGSFDGTGPSHLRNDTMYLCGPDGISDIAEPQCETDYMNATIPIFYTKVQGSTHITSGRMGWAATIAWMLWHLAGQEDQWKKEFLEPTGQFQTGIYVSETKNW